MADTTSGEAVRGTVDTVVTAPAIVPKARMPKISRLHFCNNKDCGWWCAIIAAGSAKSI